MIAMVNGRVLVWFGARNEGSITDFLDIQNIDFYPFKGTCHRLFMSCNRG